MCTSNMPYRDNKYRLSDKCIGLCSNGWCVGNYLFANTGKDTGSCQVNVYSGYVVLCVSDGRGYVCLLQVYVYR